MAVDFQEFPVGDAQQADRGAGLDYIGDSSPDGIVPFCAVDSVIPDASGWPLDADFLKKMKLWWFETSGVPLD